MRDWGRTQESKMERNAWLKRLVGERHHPASTAMSTARGACNEPTTPVNRDDLFDNLSKIMASPIPRRETIRLAALAIAGVTLTSLGIKPAWARTNCFCNGVPL